eukprot:1127906-Prorocentrum_minimum.AAC.1
MEVDTSGLPSERTEMEVDSEKTVAEANVAGGGATAAGEPEGTGGGDGGGGSGVEALVDFCFGLDKRDDDENNAEVDAEYLSATAALTAGLFTCRCGGARARRRIRPM